VTVSTRRFHWAVPARISDGDQRKAVGAEMGGIEPRPPLQPGDTAPDFTLTAVDREGNVSLADYRGRSPVLLAMFRGLYCSFCRRHIAQLARTRVKLLDVGVETLAIVATRPDRARLYFRFRPFRVPVAADPALLTHRAYGLPRAATPEFMRALFAQTVRLPEFPRPLPFAEAGEFLHRLDSYEWSETDREESERIGAQAIGQFLVDREGIIRWVNLETTGDAPAGAGMFPSDEELLAAARQVAG
jgi:peroxiredoxin